MAWQLDLDADDLAFCLDRPKLLRGFPEVRACSQVLAVCWAVAVSRSWERVCITSTRVPKIQEVEDSARFSRRCLPGSLQRRSKVNFPVLRRDLQKINESGSAATGCIVLQGTDYAAASIHSLADPDKQSNGLPQCSISLSSSHRSTATVTARAMRTAGYLCSPAGHGHYPCLSNLHGNAMLDAGAIRAVGRLGS
eukprot:1137512-Pelagomonas_calceolata.AAC.5